MSLCDYIGLQQSEINVVDLFLSAHLTAIIASACIMLMLKIVRGCSKILISLISLDVIEAYVTDICMSFK